MSDNFTKEAFPSDQQLIVNYAEIESTAIAAFSGNRVIGNRSFDGTFLERREKDRRYSLCAQGMILGSPAHKLLTDAMDVVGSIQPGFITQPKEFLHLTLSEVAYHEEGRKFTQVNRQSAVEYHQALTTNLPDHPNAIGLVLHRIIPTLDPKVENTATASLVGAFLTGGDTSIYDIRSQIKQSVELNQLNYSARLGQIRVLFVTLGRFSETPMRTKSGVALLIALEELNGNIPANTPAEIRELQLISTATSYPLSNGHVFIDPAVDLSKPQRSNKPIRLLNPKQKIDLINIS